MIALSPSRLAAIAGGVALILSACVPAQQYDALQNDYDRLNQQLSSEIGAQQVHITRLQGAIKVAVNSELLFPSGGWEMPPAAAQTIAKMAPILAPFQQTTIIVTGYTDNVPIGPPSSRCERHLSSYHHRGLRNDAQIFLSTTRRNHRRVVAGTVRASEPGAGAGAGSEA